ncbi:MAG: site-specific integrase [Phycisphaerales bacterium]|nr:site-specific integrase [Phycisphaerales bacterium]
MSSSSVKRSQPRAAQPRTSASAHERRKPTKPYAEFPLFAHATGRWAKKIRGKFVFFGPWDDPFGALERYTSQRDALHAGLVPRAAPASRSRVDVEHAGGRTTFSGHTVLANATSGERGARASRSRFPARGVSTVAGGGGAMTLRELVNRFLTAKQRRLDLGEMSPRSFNDYFHTASLLIDGLGKDRRADDITSADFGQLRTLLAKGRGPISLSAHIQRVRCMFKHAYDAGHLDRPVRFGPEFQKPGRKAIRTARNARGERMFEPDEIKRLLGSAGLQMKAMILLAVNAGLGNTDLATLPRTALDLKKGVLDYPRPKTGVERRAVLWPETVEAVRRSLAARPEPREVGCEDLVFLTKYGRAWVRTKAPGARSKGRATAIAVDAIGLEFGKLARETGLARPGRSFYALRHVFRTVADEVGDRPAIDLIMGHENGNDIATHYVERISDERLRKVTDHVRGWLGIAS